MAALAEPDEGRVRIFQLRLAAFHPEIPPFLLEEIHIIARRYDPGVMVGFGINRRKQGRFRSGQGLHGLAVREPNVAPVKHDRIVRDMVVHGVFSANVAYQPPKLLVARGGATFFPQQIKRNGPFILLAAMFARQLVHAPFQGLAQPEIVPVQRQHLMLGDGVVDPIGQVDAHFGHAPGIRMAHDIPAINQPKSARAFNAPGLDVGFNARPAQAFERGDQLLIAAPVDVPVGRNQQVMRLDVQRSTGWHAGLHFGDQLADAVDQNILVMNGRQAQGTRAPRRFLSRYVHTRGRLNPAWSRAKKWGAPLTPCRPSESRP